MQQGVSASEGLMRINHCFTGGAKVTGREEYLKLRFCGVFSIEGMPVGWGRVLGWTGGWCRVKELISKARFGWGGLSTGMLDLSRGCQKWKDSL